MTQLRCSRCQEVGEAMAHAPYPGALGATIRDQICRRCWDQWREMEVRVINELKLNFMDPASQGVLEQKLREFLRLTAG